MTELRRGASRTGVVLCLGLFLLGRPVPTRAAEAAQGETTAAPAEPTPEERKLQEKERRIEEYLRNREAKRAQRERARLQQAAQAAGARELESQQLAEKTAPPAPAPATAPAATPPRELKPLGRPLAEAQNAVRSSALGKDPTVQRYLELIEQGHASALQLAAFGSFLADNELDRVARIYYEAALRLESRDPLLWLNYGTLNRQLGDFSKAEQAFTRTLSLNPSNAMAHYNLGAIADQEGKYKRALREYKTALTLDPTLGDPSYNPQAATNDRLLAVRLMIYEERSGTVGLPLVEIQGGGLAPSE